MKNKTLKKRIALILALSLLLPSTVTVYSEPVDNPPENQEEALEPADPAMEDTEASEPQNEDVNLPEDGYVPAQDGQIASESADNAAQDGYCVSENEYDLYDYALFEDEDDDITGAETEASVAVGDSVSTGSLKRLIKEAAVGTETSIYLNEDVSLSSQLKVNGGRNIVLNLNGHTLTGKGKYLPDPEFTGLYDIAVYGTGTKLKIEDCQTGSGEIKSKGKYTVSENNGIAVFGQAEFELCDTLLEQNEDSYILASVNTGGRISVSSGSVSGNIECGPGGKVSLKGGKYSFEPDPAFLEEGYGLAVYKAARLYRYEVKKKITAYLKTELDEGCLLDGVTLSECGIKTYLADEKGERIKGAVLSGGRYAQTDEDGGHPVEISLSTSFNDVGSTHYLTALNDRFPNEIEITDAADRNAVLTDVFDIVNKDRPDKDRLCVCRVEDSSGDTLSIKRKEGSRLYFGRGINDPFEFFDLSYIHNGEERTLNKNNNVRFIWSENKDDLKGGRGTKEYGFKGLDAGNTVYVRTEFLGKTAYADINIEKQPVIIEGTEISSLVGDELIRRYYSNVSVYPLNSDGTRDTVPVSGNIAISSWFDVNSSLIDVTGISNKVKGRYDRAELTDLKALKEEKSRNYELAEVPGIVYSVEPSIVLEFKTPEGEIIADKRIMDADSRSCVIGAFKNGRPASEAKWMVKSVLSEDGGIVENAAMTELGDAGISVNFAQSRKGAVFTFTDTEKVNEGACYILYEILPEVKVSGKSKKVLTVSPITPVVYNGEKFVAKDDLSYIKDGIVKKGYSSLLDIEVYEGKKKLDIGTDYVLSYRNNKKVSASGNSGKPVVIITGKGDYAGSKLRAYFTIMPADISGDAGTAKKGGYDKNTGHKLKTGGINKSVRYDGVNPLTVDDFIKPYSFYAKAPSKRYNYYDYSENHVLSIDLTDSKDENTANILTGTGIEQKGTYYLKLELTRPDDQKANNIYGPTYIKVKVW